MTTVVFFDTKPYDRRYMEQAAQGKSISLRFHEFRLSQETAALAEGADAVCVFVNDVLDEPCLEILQRVGVRLVCLRYTGFNNVDLEAAGRLGLAVVRVPAYSPYAVAEHALALLLTLNRKIHVAYNRVRDHNFSLNGLIGFDLHGKSVGVIGTGKIGRVAAKIFSGFGMQVLAYDVQCDEEWAQAQEVRYAALDTVLAESDVVSLHLPLTPQSRHLLNRESLAKMKRGAYLVNTSRGKLIETRALLEAIKSGHLGGVALDVYEEEEGIFFEDLSGEMLRDDELARLLTFPNVLITSHQAFLTHEALTEIARTTVDNLVRMGEGRELLEETVLVKG